MIASESNLWVVDLDVLYSTIALYLTNQDTIVTLSATLASGAGTLHNEFDIVEDEVLDAGSLIGIITLQTTEQTIAAIIVSCLLTGACYHLHVADGMTITIKVSTEAVRI